MKDMLVPIDNAGRIVLPKGVREELAIHPGDLLKISVHGDQVTLRPDREKAGFVKRGHALVFSTGETELVKTETVEFVRRRESDRLSADMAKELPQPKRR